MNKRGLALFLGAVVTYTIIAFIGVSKSDIHSDNDSNIKESVKVESHFKDLPNYAPVIAQNR